SRLTATIGWSGFLRFCRQRGTPRDLDQRRPHDTVANPVAAAQLGDDGVLGMLGRLLVADRLVALGIEPGADRVYRLQAVGAKRLLPLAHAPHVPCGS